VVKTELVKIREYRDDCTVDYGKRVLSISFRISFLGDFWVRFLVNLVPENTESTVYFTSTVPPILFLPALLLFVFTYISLKTVLFIMNQ
jgi:hypothetical protein